MMCYITVSLLVGCNTRVVCVDVRNCGITEAIMFINLLSISYRDRFIRFVIRAVLIQV